MMMKTKQDKIVFDRLSIVTFDGFEGKPRHEGDTDPIGSANYLCESYGMASDGAFEGEGSPGILWSDYDHGTGPRRFSVLIDSAEVDALTSHARDAGYDVVRIDPVTEPTYYGDGHAGTVEILRHRDGWVVLD